MLVINDAVYGKVTLDEPVLEEILAIPALLRLQHVLQSGISGWLGIAPGFSRYDHSVGVMLLLRRLGAPLIEQIAGLIHDISHTAFSHVVDFVQAESGDSYHERMWPVIVARSAIPGIVARYGINWHTLNPDEGDFPLLEQPAPLLCADRVDYFLRTIVPAGLGDQEKVRYLLSHLTVAQGQIAVDDVDAARQMAELYLQMDARMWTSPREIALYWMLAQAMRLAVHRGLLVEQDWYEHDRDLWRKLTHLDDAEIQGLLAYVSAETEIGVL